MKKKLLKITIFLVLMAIIAGPIYAIANQFFSEAVIDRQEAIAENGLASSWNPGTYLNQSNAKETSYESINLGIEDTVQAPQSEQANSTAANFDFHYSITSAQKAAILPLLIEIRDYYDDLGYRLPSSMPGQEIWGVHFNNQSVGSVAHHPYANGYSSLYLESEMVNALVDGRSYTLGNEVVAASDLEGFIKGVLVHEFVHGIMFRYQICGLGDAMFYHEMFAAFLELQYLTENDMYLYGTKEMRTYSINKFLLEKRSLALETGDDVNYGYGSTLFAAYLYQEFGGHSVIQSIFEIANQYYSGVEIPRYPDYITLYMREPIDVILQEEQSSFNEAYLNFMAWMTNPTHYFTTIDSYYLNDIIAIDYDNLTDDFGVNHDKISTQFYEVSDTYLLMDGTDDLDTIELSLINLTTHNIQRLNRNDFHIGYGQIALRIDVPSSSQIILAVSNVSSGYEVEIDYQCVNFKWDFTLIHAPSDEEITDYKVNFNNILFERNSLGIVDKITVSSMVFYFTRSQGYNNSWVVLYVGNTQYSETIGNYYLGLTFIPHDISAPETTYAAVLYNVTFDILPYCLPFQIYNTMTDTRIENVNIFYSGINISTNQKQITISQTTVKFIYTQGQFGYAFTDFEVVMRCKGTQYDGIYNYMWFTNSNLFSFYVFPDQINATTIEYTAVIYNLTLILD